MDVRDMIKDINDHSINPYEVSLVGVVNEPIIQYADRALFHVLVNTIDRRLVQRVIDSLFKFGSQDAPNIKLAALRALCT